MKKFIIILILLLIGTGLFTLASINDSLTCSHANNSCSLVSRIRVINYKVSESTFRPRDISNTFCATAYQPNAGGKKPYYLLKIKLKDKTEYTIGSYNKQQLCKIYSDKINDFRKHKMDEIEYSPTFGFLNLMVAIFGFLMYFIAYQVFRAKPEEDTDWDDEFEDDENDENIATDEEKTDKKL